MKRLVSLITICVLLTGLWPAAADAQETRTYPGITYTASLLKNLATTDIKNHWAKKSIYKMTALGVIKPSNGKYSPQSKVSREMALAMLINFMGKQSDAARAAVMVGTANNRDAWAEGYLNFAVQQNIISAADKFTLNWRGTATREEVATWMGKCLGFQPVYGDEQQAVYNFNDVKSINQANLPYIEPVVASGLIQGKGQGYFKPKDSMTRAELCAVLDAASPLILPARGFTYIEGSVVYIDSSSALASYYPGYSPGGLRAVYYLLDNQHQPFALVRDENTAVKRNFLVMKNGTLGGSEKLAVGDVVDAVINNRGEVVWAEVASSSPSTMYVTLEGIDMDKKTIQVKDASNKTLVLNLSPGYRVDLDGYYGELDDLIVGQPLTLVMKDNRVKEIRSAVSYEYPGNEVLEARTVTGTLLYKSSSELEIKDDDGNRKVYKIDSSTTFVRRNSLVQWSDLQAGDYLKIYLKSYTSDLAYKVEAATLANAVYGIYRAKIQTVDTAASQIAFGDLQKYESGSWGTSTAFTYLPVASDALLYSTDTRLSLDTLKASYTGYYAYFITSTAYGQERIVRLTVKKDYEDRYSGKINSIGVNLASLSVEDVASEIKFDDGTIVVRDGKQLRPESLAAGDQGVFFCNEENDVKRAKLIVIETISAPSLAFYRGRIDTIRSSYFDIDMYSMIVDNEWDKERSASSTQRFVYTDDAVWLNGIISSQVESLSKDEFINNGLSGDYDNAVAYIIADGDTALAVNLTAKVSTEDLSLREYTGERISTGKVASVDRSAGTVTLTDVKNWDGASDEWSRASSEATFNLGKAVVVKNKRGANINYIEKGDQLYFLRAGTTPLLVVAQ